MTAARLRVRAVRMKSGGASVRVLYPDDRSVRRGDFIDDARSIADRRPDLVGYAVVAWDGKGGTSVACGSAGAPIPLMMLPSFVQTCVADWVHAHGAPDAMPEPDNIG